MFTEGPRHPGHLHGREARLWQCQGTRNVTEAPGPAAALLLRGRHSAADGSLCHQEPRPCPVTLSGPQPQLQETQRPVASVSILIVLIVCLSVQQCTIGFNQLDLDAL